MSRLGRSCATHHKPVKGTDGRLFEASVDDRVKGCRRGVVGDGSLGNSRAKVLKNLLNGKSVNHEDK
jgi:hypothetical protein